MYLIRELFEYIFDINKDFLNHVENIMMSKSHDFMIYFNYGDEIEYTSDENMLMIDIPISNEARDDYGTLRVVLDGNGLKYLYAYFIDDDGNEETIEYYNR